MRFSVRQSIDPMELVQRDIERAERQVSQAMRKGAAQLKADWRGQIRQAGLGNRLSNTVRAAAYPQSQPSINAAALVWTKAPAIISAHDEGAMITGRDGIYLAVPLDAAGRGRFNRKMTPAAWEQRTGLALRFVYRRGRAPLLVADDARLSKRGRALKKRGKRRQRDGILTGAQTVPIFVLLRQVKLQKRTDLIGGAEAIAGQVQNELLFQD